MSIKTNMHHRNLAGLARERIDLLADIVKFELINLEGELSVSIHPKWQKQHCHCHILLTGLQSKRAWLPVSKTLLSIKMLSSNLGPAANTDNRRKWFRHPITNRRSLDSGVEHPTVVALKRKAATQVIDNRCQHAECLVRELGSSLWDQNPDLENPPSSQRPHIRQRRQTSPGSIGSCLSGCVAGQWISGIPKVAFEGVLDVFPPPVVGLLDTF